MLSTRLGTVGAAVLLVIGCASCSGSSHPATPPTADATSSGTSAPSSDSANATPRKPAATGRTVTVAPGPTPAITSSISASPAGLPWDDAAARTHIRTIIASARSALAKLAAVSPDSTTTRVRHVLAEFAASDQSAVTALASGRWPHRVLAKVDDCIAALDTERRQLVALTRLSNLAAMRTHATSLTAPLAAVQADENALLRALHAGSGSS